ncbi:MAG: serine protease [Burkholderiales bacterium]
MRSFARLLLFLISFAAGIMLYGTDQTDGPRRPRVELPVQGDGKPYRSERTVPLLPPPSRGDPVIDVEGGRHGGSSVGSAFAMHESGIWLTARHVVDGCKIVAVRGRFGWARVQVVWLHPRADLAIFRTRGAPTHFELSGAPVRQGMEGYAMGYPQGRPGSVRGLLIGRTQMRSPELYAGTAATLAWAEAARAPAIGGSLGGISGGPVLDEAGNVLGVIVAELPRRGRFETLAPEVLQEVAMNTQLLPRGRAAPDSLALDANNFGRVGDQLRAQFTVAQMGCSGE